MNQTNFETLRYKLRNEDTKPPVLASQFAAGYDLTNDDEDFTIRPGEMRKINTGVAVALPDSTVGQLHVRSSTGIKLRLNLANDVGIIDEDYRGWIYATVVNTGDEDQEIKRGQRLFQLILMKVDRLDLEQCDELDETARNIGATGSTGKF